MSGAYITAYSTGDSPTAAAEQVWQALRGMGYVVEDLLPEGGAVSLAHWDEHIAERWPDFRDHFPTGDALPGVLKARQVILGPFAGFE